MSGIFRCQAYFQRSSASAVRWVRVNRLTSSNWLSNALRVVALLLWCDYRGTMKWWPEMHPNTYRKSNCWMRGNCFGKDLAEREELVLARFLPHSLHRSAIHVAKKIAPSASISKGVRDLFLNRVNRIILRLGQSRTDGQCRFTIRERLHRRSQVTFSIYGSRRVQNCETSPRLKVSPDVTENGSNVLRKCSQPLRR